MNRETAEGVAFGAVAILALDNALWWVAALGKMGRPLPRAVYPGGLAGSGRGDRRPSRTRRQEWEGFLTATGGAGSNSGVSMPTASGPRPDGASSHHCSSRSLLGLMTVSPGRTGLQSQGSRSRLSP